MEKMIIVSAPSGAGKTSIVKKLLEAVPNLMFSISATSRQKRNNETDGKDYYFLSTADFKDKINAQDFIEWEEVYTNTFYGTLKSEVDRIWNIGKNVIFDVDVKGGLNIKNQFGDKALAIFILPPSIKILEERLRNRNTNNEEDIIQRLAKAEYELGFAQQFDKQIINDDLQTAVNEIINMVKLFLQ
ncbi:MAG: guanylate kinase [Bacteroidales bacterium]|jgi:guanylate kinase|nr:guanylate kinase [Bacteroidales bacterium]MDD3913304.1 guanylate kinase [Bacteroidales bacterium]MDD4633335.1 guanylate kinase [Bacteroidales bacterium]